MAVPAAQKGQGHDSKVVAVGVVEPAAVRICLAEEACVGAEFGAVDSLGPREQCTMMVRQVVRSSRPTFAMDACMSHSKNKFAAPGRGHT